MAGSRSGSSRLVVLWTQTRDSLWFVPGIGAITGIAAAMLTLAFPLSDGAEDSWISPILFSGAVESARGVLSTIAGSLITVTGVVFSVTIVTLQLASTQFTPRVMYGFIADRTNQAVLAIFIGTFTYTLVVLGALGSSVYGDDGVPVIAVSVSILLLLVSVGALILFINRAARSAQVSTILARETEKALARGGRLFPDGLGEGVHDDQARLPDTKPASVAAIGSGYIQGVNGDELLKVASEHDLFIEMRVRIGEFTFPGKELGRVWPAERVTREVRDSICGCFLTGSDRTPEQDIEFSIGAVADIGVKALSSGINDPTTALLVIDRLTEMLAAISGDQPAPLRAGSDGVPRFLARGTTFERASGIAFDQLRVHGAGNPAIVKKVLDSCLELLHRTGESETKALRREASLMLTAARQKCQPEELPPIEELADRVIHDFDNGKYLQSEASR